jgi:hypothetical protein
MYVILVSIQHFPHLGNEGSERDGEKLGEDVPYGSFDLNFNPSLSSSRQRKVVSVMARSWVKMFLTVRSILISTHHFPHLPLLQK